MSSWLAEPAGRANGRRISLLIGGAFLAAFVAARLPLLLRPLFLDEALVLTWASRDLGLAWERGLSHGRPLLVLTLWPVVRAVRALDLSEPWALVVAARSVTVGVAAVGALATARLAAYVEPRSALPALALLALWPMRVFYDAQLLADVWLSTGVALALLASLRFVDEPSLGRGALVAATVMLTTAAKTPGALLALAPLAIALVRPSRSLKPAALAALAALVPASVAAAAVKAEAVSLVGFEPRRVTSAIGWLVAWASWPVTLLLLVGLVGALARRDRPQAGLAVALALGLAGCGFVSPLYPRYILPLLSVAAPLAAIGLVGIARARLGHALLTVLLSVLVIHDAQLWMGQDDPLPAADLEQYRGPAGGRGTSEAAEVIVSKLGDRHVVAVWVVWQGDRNATQAWRARSLEGYFAGSKRIQFSWGARPQSPSLAVVPGPGEEPGGRLVGVFPGDESEPIGQLRLFEPE